MLLSNRWLTAKWATPRKAAGTAAERDGSTVGRVVVDGAITGDGDEVRHHGHQLGGTGESTAGGRDLHAVEPSLRSRVRGDVTDVAPVALARPRQHCTAGG